MSVTVILGEDALAPETWERHDVDDVCAFLTARYDTFPDTARIYHNHVAQNCDVTPSDEWGVKRLQELDGTLYVIVYPGDPITIIIAVVAVAAVAAAAFLLLPKIPNSALRNTQTESPNNALSDRQNKPRPMGRIPDVYGTVRSTPDLIAVPYNVFEAHQEVEYAYMAVGRGEYDIPASGIKDDTTLVSDLAGATVEIFAPYTSPNSGDDPQLRVGSAITEPVRSAVRSNAVNGQVVRPPNADSFAGANDIRFSSPDEIQLDAASEADFTDVFAAGDTVVISDASYTGTISGSGVDVNVSVRFDDSGTVEVETGDTSAFSVGHTLQISGAYFEYNSGANAIDLSGTYVIQGKTTTVLTLQSPENVNTDWNLLAANFTDGTTDYKTCNLVVPSGQTTIDLAGTYTVLSVTSNIITLSNPSTVNTDWNTLASFASGQTDFISPVIETTSDKWIGPFVLDRNDLTAVYANFVALNGLYKDDGKKQIRFDVQVELELTPVDNTDTPTGAAETFTATIEGSSTSRTTRAITVKAEPTFTGRCLVRARRVTDADLDYEGTVVDEIKWRDVYQMSPVSLNDFGDVTTVHSITYATSGALAVKDRKLNMIATRKIPTRVSGSTFTAQNYPTNNVAEILCAVSLDPRIGNRNVAELDVDNIYDTIAEVAAYFGTDLAAEFNYTFDNDNLSYEETVATIASAVFCSAYRRGNVIKLKFDRATDDSVLLFNHRNKLPGTEERSIRFGNQDDNDGVEYSYVDPEDDALVTLYLPEDKTAVNPKKVDSIGVRSYALAYFHAWRIWNKTRFQNVATEFEATQEADLLLISDRILVADNTRPGTQDGEVIAQSGLSLELSQEITFSGGEDYTIFLQHVDGTVEAIPVTAGASSRLVTLAYAPKAPLALDDDFYARALYQIVGNSSKREQAFLVTEKEPQDRFTSIVRAVNYSPKYYDKDGLRYWLPFNDQTFNDAGPIQISGTPNNTAAVVADGTRGFAYEGSTTTDYVSAPDLTGAESYTKAAWVYKTNDGVTSNILGANGGNNEAFFIHGSTSQIRSGHSGSFTQVTYPMVFDQWVHLAVTYDADTTTLKLYVNGEEVSANTSVAQRTLIELMPMGYNANNAFRGRVDDLRYYTRPLSDYEIKSLYQRTI